MLLGSRGPVLGYAIASLGVLALVLVHGTLGRPTSSDVMLFGFLLLIALAGYVGGFGPALLGTLLASVLRVAFTLPRGSFRLSAPADQGRLLILMGTGVLIALLARWAHDRGRAALAESERVRHSEERFRLASQAVQGVLYDLDVASGRFWASEGMTRLVGVAADPAGFTHDWWTARMHPDDRLVMEREIARLLAGDENTWNGRYRVRHEDGHWVHVWDSARMLRDATGRLVRVVGYSMDVSAEVAAQASLREREERLSLATSVVRGAVYDRDFATGRVWWSDGLEQLVGVAPEDVPPTREWWLERLHPDDRARLERDGVGHGGPVIDSEYRVRHEDGHYLRVWDRMRVLPAADGTPRRAVGYTMDVSALYAAEAARRASELRLQLAVEAVGLASWDFDLATSQLTWSDSHFALFGCDPQRDGPARMELWRRHVHPDDLPGMVEAVSAAMTSGAPYEHVYRIRRADTGEERILSARGRTVPGDDLRPARFVGVVFDVTEQANAQEALRRRAEEFEGLLRVLPAAVWHAHDKDCRVITGNVYATRLTPPVEGSNVSAALPDDNRTWRLVAPDGDPLAVAEMPLQRAAASGRPVEGIEVAVQRPDGSRTPLLGGAVPLFDGDGGVRGAVAAFVDITDRKRVEEELREARLLVEKIAATAPGILYLYDTVERRNVYANRAMTDVLGYTPEEVAAAGDRLAELIVPPEDADALATLEAAQRQLRPGETHRSEMRLRHRDGSLRWIRGHETVFSTAADGTPRLIVGLSLDVTQEKETIQALEAGERRLRDSERRLRELADAMPQIVFVNRADGSLEFVNRQWETLTGDSGDDHDAVIEHVHPDDRAQMLDRWNSDRPLGQPYATEFRLRLADGSYRWFLSRAVPVRGEDGEVVRWFGTSTDIDAQKRAQSAARQAEARQRMLADAALRINASLSVAQPLEATLELVTELSRDILGAHEALLLASRASEPSRTVRVVSQSDSFARAQRERPPVRSRLAVPLVGRDGRNLGVLRFSDRQDDGDFTAEDEAVAMQMAAMAAVAMENWELVQQIRDTDRRKDEFLATLAHELRNPLAPIGNSIELLRRAAGDPDAVGRARDTMERQMNHLVHLVDDLLDASRITSGKLALRREHVALSTVLLQAVETARPALERAGQTLDLHLPAEPAWLDADATRLTQVFSNLLHNAAKFGGQGVVTMKASVARGRAVVQVRDRGVGIPPDKLDDIFEMFAQVDRGPERSSGGLGIGLALVQRLVEMHGGTVEAASEGEGRGSTFTVSLPMVPVPDGAGSPAPAPVARPLARRILVADDNRDSADSMAALLELSGHEASAVYDGEDAVTSASRLRPDLVLLDLGMPRLDGYEAARRIRECLGTGVRLVAMTGWGDEQSRQRSRESGFDAHLTKPVDLARLLALLTPQ